MEPSWVDRYTAAWNSHDGGQVAAFMAGSVTYEDLAQGVVEHGPGGVEAYVERTRQFSGDYRFDVVSYQASGDRYALEWEMVGTDTGGGNGMAATNKPYRIRGVSVGQYDGDGKISLNRDYWNLADLLGQLGLFPPPPAS